MRTASLHSSPVVEIEREAHIATPGQADTVGNRRPTAADERRSDTVHEQKPADGADSGESLASGVGEHSSVRQ